MKHLVSCFGTNLSVPDVLGNAEGFLNISSNLECNQDAIIITSQELTEEGQEQCSEQEVQVAMKVLRRYKREVENRIAMLQNNMSKIKVLLYS